MNYDISIARYFPFNTVINVISSPTRLEEGRDSPSEESADDSDVLDSSSDGSESESSERNFKVFILIFSIFLISDYF